MTESPEAQLREQIEQAIRDNPVILFMKGTPEAPALRVLRPHRRGALQSLGAPFAAVDILPHPAIRQQLSAISEWPTIPQLFVRRRAHRRVGHRPLEMYESGELARARSASTSPKRRKSGGAGGARRSRSRTA